MRQKNILSSTTSTKFGKRMSKSYFDKPYTVAVYGYPGVSVSVQKDPSFTLGYRTLIKKKIPLPDLPYLHVRTTTHPNEGYGEVWRTMSGWNESGSKFTLASSEVGYVPFKEPASNFKQLPPIADAMSAVRRASREAAISTLLSKAKDQKANLAQAYAESRQVHKMIANAANVLAGVYTDLRRGNLRSAGMRVGVTIGQRQATRFRKRSQQANTSEELQQLFASGTLAVQYGIKPLIGDVIGTAELLAQKHLREVHAIIRTSGSAGMRNEEDSVSSSYLRVNQTITRKISITTKMGARFASREMAHTTAQLGFTNPFVLGWELMPWSFVIDWFIPIGNWLSSQDATFGLDFYGGYTSVKTVHETVTSQKWQISDPGTYVAGSVSNSVRFESFQRTTMANWPSLSAPSFKNPISATHALNAIALLIARKKDLFK